LRRCSDTAYGGSSNGSRECAPDDKLRVTRHDHRRDTPEPCHRARALRGPVAPARLTGCCCCCLAKRFSSLSSAIAAEIHASSFWWDTSCLAFAVFRASRSGFDAPSGNRKFSGKRARFGLISVPRNTGYKFPGIHNDAKFSPPIAAEMCRKNDNANFGQFCRSAGLDGAPQQHPGNRLRCALPGRRQHRAKLNAVQVDRRAHSKMVAAEHADTDDISAERPIEPPSQLASR
jgi:hypothetical protein